MPKSYGSPIGTDTPDPNRKQKATSTPAQQTAAGKDYLEHMIQAHNSFHASNPGASGKSTTPRPRGSSSYDASGKPKYNRPDSSMRIDKALKDAGA